MAVMRLSRLEETMLKLSMFHWYDLKQFPMTRIRAAFSMSLSTHIGTNVPTPNLIRSKQRHGINTWAPMEISSYRLAEELEAMVARAATGRVADMVCMALMQLDILGVLMDKQAGMEEMQAMEAPGTGQL